MKTYWDYEEKERAELTREQVQDLIKFELMANGVANPKAPDLMTETEIEVAKKVYFAICNTGDYNNVERFGVVFEKMGDAEKFLDLSPLKEDYDYAIGSQYKYAKPVVGLAIERVELNSYGEVVSLKPRLDEQAEIKKANKKAQEEYTTSLNEVERACSGLWEDWSDLRSKKHRHQCVIDTFKEYVGMCNGDKEMAYPFLLKVYSNGEIISAGEWFGDVFLSMDKEVIAVEP